MKRTVITAAMLFAASFGSGVSHATVNTYYFLALVDINSTEDTSWTPTTATMPEVSVYEAINSYAVTACGDIDWSGTPRLEYQGNVDFLPSLDVGTYDFIAINKPGQTSIQGVPLFVNSGTKKCCWDISNTAVDCSDASASYAVYYITATDG